MNCIYFYGIFGKHTFHVYLCTRFLSSVVASAALGSFLFRSNVQIEQEEILHKSRCNRIRSGRNTQQQEKCVDCGKPILQTDLSPKNTCTRKRTDERGGGEGYVCAVVSCARLWYMCANITDIRHVKHSRFNGIAILFVLLCATLCPQHAQKLNHFSILLSICMLCYIILISLFIHCFASSIFV